jgi:signal transduction histidine kinase
VNDELETRIAELKRLNALKDEFINIASHELKNLVQPILLFADLAKNGDMDKDHAIDIILANANKLRQLTSDILDVSKIESDRFVCEMGKVDIRDLLEEIVQATRLRLSPEVKLETSVTPITEELVINGDRVRLSQLLTNLINNAVKFTAKGSVMLKLKAQEDQNQLEILVSDTGSGIPTEVMVRIFEKFIPKSASQGNKQGTGLGLYISKAIVRAHNGEISAVNNSRGGATFRITLPIRQPPM